MRNTYNRKRKKSTPRPRRDATDRPMKLGMLPKYRDETRPPAEPKHAGMLIYNEDAYRVQFCDGTSWRNIAQVGDPGHEDPDADQQITVIRGGKPRKWKREW